MGFNKKIIFWVLLIFYSGLIFYLSSIALPAPEYKGISLDKLIHVLEFFGYALLTFLAFFATFFNGRLKPNVLATLLWSVMYAASDELHQHFTGFRIGSWIDFVADVFGIVLFVFVVLVAFRLNKGQKVLKAQKGI